MDEELITVSTLIKILIKRSMNTRSKSFTCLIQTVNQTEIYPGGLYEHFNEQFRDELFHKGRISADNRQVGARV